MKIKASELIIVGQLPKNIDGVQVDFFLKSYQLRISNSSTLYINITKGESSFPGHHVCVNTDNI